MARAQENLDLPLSANTDEINIRHFILDLALCDFKSRRIGGVVTFFCFPNGINKKDNSCATRKNPTCAPLQIEGAACTSNQFSIDSKVTASKRIEVDFSGTDCTSDSVQSDALSSEKTEVSEASSVPCKEGRPDGLISHSEDVGSGMQTCSSGKEELPQKSFLTLDCYDIGIVGVEEVEVPSGWRLRMEVMGPKERVKADSVYTQCSELPGHPLAFRQEKHCMHIYRQPDGGHDGGDGTGDVWPVVIRVRYCTKPSGPSLMWTRDQDGKECVFTIGHQLSNRSLFPSMDAPAAMPTWRARVTVPVGAQVLMSGDRVPKPAPAAEDCEQQQQQVFECYTSMPMPTCTLALAVGQWAVKEIWSNGDELGDCTRPVCAQHGARCTTNYSKFSILPSRLVAPASLMEGAYEELSSYLPACLESVVEVLGPHPFPRLDVLIVPPCFDSLGMASPCLIFLSQSMLVGDGSMMPRLSHEVCHSWFGLLLGPADWTEEWMTEAFCTYMEDILHPVVMQMKAEYAKEYCAMRALMKYKILTAELETTLKDQQTLRPNKGEETVGGGPKTVKNGMDPEKPFIHIHYYKGYFLLKYLEQIVGRQKFLEFLQDYVFHFHECLVSSQDFLNYLCEKCPDLRSTGITAQSLAEEWLDSAGMPRFLQHHEIDKDNSLYSVVVNEFERKKPLLCYESKKKKPRTELENPVIGSHSWTSEQKILFLDLLLAEENVPDDILEAVYSSLNLHNANAEVLHAWCEVVVKNRSAEHCSHLASFLTSHQAMGVYLYGEMMLSSRPRLKELARTTFEKLRHSMPPAVRESVSLMLYGHSYNNI